MKLRLRGSISLFALLLAALPGCGGGKLPTGCDPPCGPGTRCDEISLACLPIAGDDGGMVDLATSGCSPKCAGLTPLCNAAKKCVACLADSDCPLNTFCKVQSETVATCVPGCNDDKRCGGGKCCGNRCVDSAGDAANCGGCGVVCSGAHTQAGCTGGKCVPGKCDSGWGDCNKEAKDGCETNLHVDPLNCTACGNACKIANAITACANGCYATACNWGFDDCNNEAMDGCETSVLMDGLNCGACGKSCAALPNATAGCMNGSCILGACKPGYENCDGDARNGCEARIEADAKNCGRCGVTCPMNLPYCAKGVCSQACLMGKGPPLACDTGKDPMTGSIWVVCSADCDRAWLSHNMQGGGNYHALAICQSLGYSGMSGWDGNFGTVCGTNMGAGSCLMPGKSMFARAANAPNCGMDMLGGIFCNTVEWECIK